MKEFVRYQDDLAVHTVTLQSNPDKQSARTLICCILSFILNPINIKERECS